MDDTQVATSEDQPTEDSQIAVEAPVEEGTAPSMRDALEAAYDKAKQKDAPAPEAEARPKVEEKLPEPAVEDKVTPPAETLKPVKAPQSWKADVREKFDSLPDEVKSEVLRRERDIDTALAKTAAERRLAQDFLQVAAPFESSYRAMGTDPISAAKVLFQADYTLRAGTQTQKVQLVGNLIKQYGIDLQALDEHLATGAAPQAKAGYDPELVARLDRMERFAEEQRQISVQSQQAQINTAIEEFANDPKNEFFNDVAPQMIGLLQAGTAKDLKDAYDQAIYANPSVRAVLLQREQANKARLNAGGTSLPVKGPRTNQQPASKQYKTTREALEAAWASTEGNRL